MRTALVTGGSSGIGRRLLPDALALTLIRRHFHI